MLGAHKVFPAQAALQAERNNELRYYQGPALPTGIAGGCVQKDPLVHYLTEGEVIQASGPIPSATPQGVGILPLIAIGAAWLLLQ